MGNGYASSLVLIAKRLFPLDSELNMVGSICSDTLLSDDGSSETSIQVSLSENANWKEMAILVTGFHYNLFSGILGVELATSTKYRQLQQVERA